MGLICVELECQRRGYGKLLLDYSWEKTVELGCPALRFEGNLDFYRKSGFACASEFDIR